MTHFIFVLLLFVAVSAHSSAICVRTAQGLVLALSQSQSTNPIRLVRGSYALEESFLFQRYQGLDISGGWNDTCTTAVMDPASTIITSAQPKSAGISFWIQANDARIERLSFTGIAGFNLRNYGAGSVQFLRNRYVNNGGGMDIFDCANNARIENNLFVNSGGEGEAQYFRPNVNLRLDVEDCPSVDRVAFPSSKIFNNTVIGSQRGIELVGDGGRKYLQNNIVWGATVSDLGLGAQQIDVVATTSIWRTTSVAPTGRFSVYSSISTLDPQLNSSYVPNNNSPAHNKGGSFIANGLSVLDNSGLSRVMGGRVDIGAFERLE
jgi:hypothetical protein